VVRGLDDGSVVKIVVDKNDEYNSPAGFAKDFYLTRNVRSYIVGLV
jgi:hypothetical protein